MPVPQGMDPTTARRFGFIDEEEEQRLLGAQLSAERFGYPEEQRNDPGLLATFGSRAAEEIGGIGTAIGSIPSAIGSALEPVQEVFDPQRRRDRLAADVAAVRAGEMPLPQPPQFQPLAGGPIEELAWRVVSDPVRVPLKAAGAIGRAATGFSTQPLTEFVEEEGAIFPLLDVAALAVPVLKGARVAGAIPGALRQTGTVGEAAELLLRRQNAVRKVIEGPGEEIVGLSRGPRMDAARIDDLSAEGVARQQALENLPTLQRWRAGRESADMLESQRQALGQAGDIVEGELRVQQATQRAAQETLPEVEGAFQQAMGAATQRPIVTPTELTQRMRQLEEEIAQRSGVIEGAAKDRAEAFMRGGAAADEYITRLDDTIGGEVNKLTEAQQELARTQYQVSSIAEAEGVPSYIFGDDATEWFLGQTTGTTAPPIIVNNDVTTLANRLRNQADDLKVSRAARRRQNVALHGRGKMPEDPTVRRRSSQIYDAQRTGANIIPGTADEVAEAGRVFGRDAAVDNVPPKVGMKIAGSDQMAKATKQGRALTDAMTPSVAEGVNFNGMGAWSIFRDFDKVAPTIAEFARPIIQLKNEEILKWSERYAKLTKGVRVNSKTDTNIWRVLNGDFGPAEQVISGAIKAPVQQKVLDIAGAARADLKQFWNRLGLEEQGVKYVDNYITWLGQNFGDRLPPAVLRNSGRKAYFRYTHRGNLPPETGSFIESFGTYVNAATHKIYMDELFGSAKTLEDGTQIAAKPWTAARQQLDARMEDLRRKTEAMRVTGNRAEMAASRQEMLNLRNVAIQMDGVESHLLGRAPSKLEMMLDSALVSVGKSVGLDIASQPAARLSMALATGMYRGVLGVNFSAAINNLTQTVNTMAAAGVMPTMRGIVKFVGSEAPARSRNVLRKLGMSSGEIETTMAQQAKLQQGFSRMFTENRKFGSKMITMDKFLFAPFNAAEYINRGIAFHTGVGQAMKTRGLKTLVGAPKSVVDDVVREGVDLASQTQFVYDELARSPIFRGPIGRQFGVLTSFPIKQSEFLIDLAKNNKAGLFRYMASVGLASWAMERFFDTKVGALGGAEVAGMELPIPGTEFLTSIARGTPSPAIQLAADAQDMLSGFSRGDKVEGTRAMGRVFDGVSNLIPASVATKEVLRGFTNLTETDPETGEQVVRTRIGVTPFLREVTPLGPRVSTTNASLEVRRLFGVPSAKQAEQAQLTRDVQRRARGLSSERGRAFDLVGHALRTGRQLSPEDLEALETLGGNLEGLISSIESSEMDPLLRVWMSSSNGTKRVLISEFPELLPRLREVIAQSAGR